MSKRYIGIDLEGPEVRVAIATVTGSRVNFDYDKRSYETPEQAAEVLREMLGEVALGDRLVTALPCRVGLFRRVSFPFREKNKIEAALPLELASRLPVALDGQVIGFLPPRAEGDGYQVDAVVVNREELEELLRHIPDPQQHPRTIDFFPFALLPAFGQQDGVLIYCRRQEVVVALVSQGVIWDYRLLPGTKEAAPEELLSLINNQVSQLENAFGTQDLPLWVMGSGVNEELVAELRGSGRTILPACGDLLEEPPDWEMAPAALLALGEWRAKKRDERLNFRRGDFAARGQLELIRTRLVIAVVMLLLILAGGAATMQVSYLQKTQVEADYRAQLNQLFQQTMPPNTPLVDAPMQIESQLNELRKQVQLFGLSGQGATAVLQALSEDIDLEINVELNELSYSGDEVRIDGVTNSFDAVNQISEVLGKNPLFQRVEISNAKLSADSSRVDFELQLQLANSGGEQ